MRGSLGAGEMDKVLSGRVRWVGTRQVVVEVAVGGKEFFGAAVVRLEVGLLRVKRLVVLV
jgi:hypothetical protein